MGYGAQLARPAAADWSVFFARLAHPKGFGKAPIHARECRSRLLSVTGGWTLRQDWRVRALVWLGMAGLVVAVFVIVVVGGGLLIGQTDQPAVGLSILATGVVALTFEPARRRLERVAMRRVRGGPAAPYDLLTGFADSVTGSLPADELPDRMAMMLADATGAAWAQVWLSLRGRLSLAATWPVDAVADDRPPDVLDRSGSVSGRRVLPVQLGSRTLGALTLQQRDQAPLTPVEERLFSSLATQAGMALRNAQLRAELAERWAELSERAEELCHSTRRSIDHVRRNIMGCGDLLRGDGHAAPAKTDASVPGPNTDLAR